MAALPEPPLVTVEEYLNTSYDPDVEYVDGVLVERHVGDWLHSLVQSNIIVAIRCKYPHLRAVGELRSRVSETRFRLPDVSVVAEAPRTRYLAEAPFIAVEILSEGDTASRMTEKLDEYARKGTPNIWVIDPRLRRMSVYRAPSLTAIEGDVIATADGAVQLTRAEIFAE